MAKQNGELLDLARSVSERLAGGSLTPSCAKLYSQHTRLDAGQPGLRRWGPREAEARLDEAVRLIEAGLLQRANDDAHWTDAVLRAAELLEWLRHPSLNPDALPIDLMSAAAYQLAGYPARAAGLLGVESRTPVHAGPLHALLCGDFPRLLRNLAALWSLKARTPAEDSQVKWSDTAISTAQLRNLVEHETASALGVLCAAQRWGDHDRIDLALKKLTTVAKFMLNGRDRYSWLLAKLVAETARTFVVTALRSKLEWLSTQLDSPGKLAVERYLREAYKSRKTQAWPSQQRGIDRLAEGGSFVLCTPTGSGKTTIAEIAILQRLFSSHQETELPAVAPLAMYLVPKRAFAAEVEAKLARTIAPLSQDRIVITGLYGGIDWGPTDAWLTSDEKTVLICTYEKAEALIRFLGPLFLGRLSLVVLDEAHMVQFDGKIEDLRTAESRPLRLESLVARLLAHIPGDQCQVIALSAVAARMEGTLAKWVTGDDQAKPAKTLYRSTRQLIGRLQCKTGRSFEIQYDLLDRASLRFDDTGDGGTPFIPEPFPPHPPAPAFASAGPEKRLRPYLFWAAMHIVAPAQSERRHVVLISIPQQIGGYAEDLLNLIEDDWSSVDLPQVFEPPADTEKNDKWQRCLRACNDYFGKTSREYKLLEKGIVVHHGKMPGLMAKLLIQLVDEGFIHLILATSTLSEGVNLPFEVVLLPTLRRAGKVMTAAEIGNLAGRAGRPGYGTEGKCLVLLPQTSDRSSRAVVREYEKLIKQLEVDPRAESSSTGGESAPATLLVDLWNQWQMAAGSTNEAAFMQWLEITATLTPATPNAPADSVLLIETLDSLDSVLLASIVEIESIARTAISATELEEKLADIWRRCYAHYASQYEAVLGKWFRHRGQALATRIYPDAYQRRQLYRSGLPPRLGNQLARLYPQIRQYLISGADYAKRSDDGQFQFIEGLVELLGTHPRFAIATKLPTGATWQSVLRWWLDPTGPVPRPGAKKVSDWYEYVSTNFGYRFAWGIGCTLALAANEAHGGELQPTTLDSWDELGLPWIALWLKELMVWGTLDPVAAYVLGRGRAGTRPEAAALSADYFATLGKTLDPNEQLNPRTIRDWADDLPMTTTPGTRPKPKSSFNAKLERTFPKNANRRWRVLPTERGDRIQWVDSAGYLLASSERPPNWTTSFLDDTDFFLEVDSQAVVCEPYI